ncbi:hypothetical protein [Nonomuraea sp. NPDC002799]
MISNGAVVDMSCVCRSKHLPPLSAEGAFLSRFDLVREAWRRQYGQAPLTLVADNSLRHRLTLAEDRARLRRMEADGEVIMARYADPVLLDLAREQQLHVLSADLYRDERRSNLWIHEVTERFLGWRTTRAEVRLVPAGVRLMSLQSMSRAESAKDLDRKHRIDLRNRVHERALRSQWRCVASSCEQAMLSDHIWDYPAFRTDGTVVCGLCGTALEEVGPRPALREIVLFEARSREEILRFPVHVGQEVTVGHGVEPYSVDLGDETLPHPEARRRVSREHLQLELTGSHEDARLVAVDLGSSGGTEVLRGTVGGTGKRKMDPGERVNVGPKDQLVLGRLVVLRQSGLKYFPGQVDSSC